MIQSRISEIWNFLGYLGRSWISVILRSHWLSRRIVDIRECTTQARECARQAARSPGQQLNSERPPALWARVDQIDGNCAAIAWGRNLWVVFLTQNHNIFGYKIDMMLLLIAILQVIVAMRER